MEPDACWAYMIKSTNDGLGAAGATRLDDNITDQAEPKSSRLHTARSVKIDLHSCSCYIGAIRK